MTKMFDDKIVCNILKQEIVPDEIALYDEEQNLHISIEACKFGVKNYREGWRFDEDEEALGSGEDE